MILLHTVVNGWHQGKNRYKHLISTSMMRFQGRQTVRNMLVITVLLAGAYFASFYTPMLSAGNTLQVERRPYDYAYHYRADQELPGQGEVEQLAEEYGVTITGWKQQPMAVLAVDGEEHVEKEGPMGATWEAVYREQLHGDTFLSESAYRTLTGQDIQLEPGTVVGVFDDEGSSNGMMGNEISLVTNMVTGAQLEVTPVEPVLCYDLLFGCRVLDDGDYANITQGLTPQWQEQQVFFNVEDVDGTYDFAKALFNAIVDRSGPEVEVGDYYDLVEKAQAEAAGEPYAYDPQFVEEHGMEPIRYDQRDSSAFRVHWKIHALFPGAGPGGFRHHHGSLPHAVFVHCHRVLCGSAGHRLHPLPDHSAEQPAGLRRPAAAGRHAPLPVSGGAGAGLPGVFCPRPDRDHADLRFLYAHSVFQWGSPRVLRPANWPAWGIACCWWRH